MNDQPVPKKTPLTSRHEALGARLVPFAGYQMPIQYSGIVKEHTAVRTKAGVFDVSHMGELRLRGHGAGQLVNSLVTNDLARISLGQAMYTCACNAAGGILDDLIIYKHADDDILIVCNASNRDKIAAHVADAVRGVNDVSFADESDQTALIAVQGPSAFEVLTLADGRLAELASELRPFRFVERTLQGKTVTLARTGYTGEDGVEIFCASEDAGAVWDSLLEAGHTEGLLPTGLGARDTLRLEARLSLYGHELDETTNPFEAGLAWTVKLDQSDFLGRAALLEVQATGPSRTIVGFEMIGRGVARADYPLLDQSGKPIGRCTSGSPSPTLGKAIGLGYVPSALAAVGTSLLVDCRGKQIEARIASTPFYRRAR